MKIKNISRLAVTVLGLMGCITSFSIAARAGSVIFNDEALALISGISRCNTIGMTASVPSEQDSPMITSGLKPSIKRLTDCVAGRGAQAESSCENSNL